ncbi:acyltransferase family protein [Microlunatus parietis]|uniref:Peptidoglycan/LPS O-acetylase OafA/YrhL n=1 Tax=Microlunatus parietis TaxID=682979 RepID=A0A7Y9I9Y3_9ACTN|nr:acyltransferase [Microlunatus parietis]NYE73023.1 peptidoglycan/LPS O-acetylase OafA/YrhL [Microlunatus parietis]
MGGDRGYLPPLDGIRAFAVVAVVLFHTVVPWFPGGGVGVDVFFVLSGFLITRILVAELDRTGRISFGRFYLRRALRLLPALFALAITLTAAYLVLQDGAEQRESLFAVFAALTYIASPVLASGHHLGPLTHTWSLSVEEYFYVVWPLVLLLVTVRARRLRLPIIAALAALAVVYRLVVTLAGWPVERVHYAADTRASDLLIGCALALVLARHRLPLRDVHAVPAALFLVAFVVLPDPVTSPFYRYGGFLAVAVAAAVLIAIVVQSRQGPTAKLLGSAPLVWIGKRSYGIYLWNPPLSAFAGFALPQGMPVVAVVLVLSFVVPALSYRIVEQPFLRLKTTLAERTKISQR